MMRNFMLINFGLIFILILGTHAQKSQKQLLEKPTEKFLKAASPDGEAKPDAEEGADSSAIAAVTELPPIRTESIHKKEEIAGTSQLPKIPFNEKSTLHKVTLPPIEPEGVQGLEASEASSVNVTTQASLAKIIGALSAAQNASEGSDGPAKGAESSEGPKHGAKGGKANEKSGKNVTPKPAENAEETEEPADVTETTEAPKHGSTASGSKSGKHDKKSGTTAAPEDAEDEDAEEEETTESPKSSASPKKNAGKGGKGEEKSKKVTPAPAEAEESGSGDDEEAEEEVTEEPKKPKNKSKGKKDASKSPKKSSSPPPASDGAESSGDAEAEEEASESGDDKAEITTSEAPEVTTANPKKGKHSDKLSTKKGKSAKKTTPVPEPAEEEEAEESGSGSGDEEASGDSEASIKEIPEKKNSTDHAPAPRKNPKGGKSKGKLEVENGPLSVTEIPIIENADHKNLTESKSEKKPAPAGELVPPASAQGSGAPNPNLDVPGGPSTQPLDGGILPPVLARANLQLAAAASSTKRPPKPTGHPPKGLAHSSTPLNDDAGDGADADADADADAEADAEVDREVAAVESGDDEKTKAKPKATPKPKEDEEEAEEESSGDEEAGEELSAALIEAVNEEFANALKNLTDEKIIKESDYENKQLSDLFALLLENLVGANPDLSEKDQKILVHRAALEFERIFKEKAETLYKGKAPKNVTEIVRQLSEEFVAAQAEFQAAQNPDGAGTSEQSGDGESEGTEEVGGGKIGEKSPNSIHILKAAKGDGNKTVNAFASSGNNSSHFPSPPVWANGTQGPGSGEIIDSIKSGEENTNSTDGIIESELPGDGSLNVSAPIEIGKPKNGSVIPDGESEIEESGSGVGNSSESSGDEEIAEPILPSESNVTVSESSGSQSESGSGSHESSKEEDLESGSGSDSEIHGSSAGNETEEIKPIVELSTPLAEPSPSEKPVPEPAPEPSPADKNQTKSESKEKGIENVAVMPYSFKIVDAETDWDSELENKDSFQFKTLYASLLTDLKTMFKKLDPKRFIGVTIDRFSHGSIIVEGEAQLSERVESGQFLENFLKLLNEQENKIGGKHVEPASVAFDGKPSDRLAQAKNPGPQSWVIGLAVAGSILAAIIVAVVLIIVLRRFRNRRYSPSSSGSAADVEAMKASPRVGEHGKHHRQYQVPAVPATAAGRTFMGPPTYYAPYYQQPYAAPH